MRRVLVFSLFSLVWGSLLAVVLYSFEHAEPENQVCVWVVAGLLPLALVILSQWSRGTKSEERAVFMVALAGWGAVAVVLYFDLPLWRWVQPDVPLATDEIDLPLDDNSESADDDELSLGSYDPTPQEVVEKMLSFANVTEDDVVYDLGCGDGRIVITAASKYGARGVGIDLDPRRVKESLKNVEKAAVQDLVEIRKGDAMNVEDLNRATVVALYIDTKAAIRLRPTLEEELAPGSRIVSHRFDFGPWEPHRMTQLYVDGAKHLIYLWEIGKAEKPSDDDERAE